MAKDDLSTLIAVLGDAAGGDITARVDLSEIGEEYSVLGESINSMIDCTKKREEELKNSRETSSKLIGENPVPMTIVDEDLNLLEANKAYFGITGYSREDLIGKNLRRDFKVVETIEQVNLSEAMEKKEKAGRINTIDAPNGIFTFIIGALPYKDVSTGENRVLMTFTDIAELEKHETEVKDVKKRIEDIMNNLPVGLVTYRADDPGKKWETVNPALEEIVGYKADEMLGRKTEEEPFSTDEAAKILTEQRKRYDALPVYELPWITKSGERIIVSVHVGSIKDVQGDITDYTFTVQDVTKERKREEESRKLSTMVENSGTPTILAGTTGRWEYVNPIFEKFFGFKSEEVLGKNTVETPMITEEAKKIISEHRELYGKDVVTFEIPLVKRSGEVAHILLTQTCIYDGDEEIINWVVELRDITNLRNLIDQIKDTVLVLNTAIKELNAAYDQISTASEDIAGAMNSTAQGAEDQATSLNNIINSMEDLAEQSKSFMRMSGEIEKSADLMRDVLEGSSSKAIEAGMSLDEIYRTLGENAKEIKDLSSEVSKVSKLTDFINSVADKTDTLGLVAGVVSDISGSGNEGEGKGLRSIAKRIDDLAKSSSNYAREAKGIIEGLSKRINDTIEESDRTIESVMDSKTRIKGALDSLNEINELTSSNIERTVKITEIGAKQIEGMDSVKQMAGDAGSIATEYASQVEEVSASVEEQSASIEETKATIENLAEIMDKLEKLIR
ncbi:MAG: Sensory rhodopsin I transducer [Candidatus Methanolliviera sp. GoM_oil]|nr:MAG: Sensory rhodopsin I transducer [Candidatus Methanolliviera sp. GoM_oil]